jgi:hypothetical protein
MSAPAHIARENGKKGGRPKGKKTAKTLEREAIQKLVNERYMRAADRLANAQIALAVGSQYLYKIEKEWVKTGKSGYYRKLKPKLVTAQAEIEMYLEGVSEGDPEDDQDPGATYYFITTMDPQNPAIDSAFNRALGKPKEVVDMTVKGDLTIKEMFEIAKKGKNKE